MARALGGVLIDTAEATALELPGQVPSAVLVPLFLAEPPAPQGIDGLHAVFTRRRGDLRRHAGEVSFPGGRRDGADADLRATALREAQEEIGLDAADVTVVGALAPTSTFATNYAIHPFVGLIAPGREWQLSPREVEEVLEHSLTDLRAGYRRADVTRRGVTFRTDAYAAGDTFIWGATARMLGDLLDRMEVLERSAA